MGLRKWWERDGQGFQRSMSERAALVALIVYVSLLLAIGGGIVLAWFSHGKMEHGYQQRLHPRPDR